MARVTSFEYHAYYCDHDIIYIFNNNFDFISNIFKIMYFALKQVLYDVGLNNTLNVINFLYPYILLYYLCVLQIKL